MSIVAGRQILGARERQEDAFRIIQQDDRDPGADLLLLLADGMGGHVGGDVASALVLEAFETQFIQTSRIPKPQPRLVEAMEVANAALRDRIAQDPALTGMGATLIAVFKIGNRLHWLSVGDSLLYLFRDGALRRLNADHSVHGELLELVQKGQMSRQEADNHPRRNALRSAMTGDRIALVDTGHIALQAQDLFVLASDGIETLDEAQIAALMAQGDSVRTLGAALLSAVEAERRPKQDNTTVVAYRYDPAGEGRRRDSLIVLPEEPALRRSPWLAAAVVGGLIAAAGIVYAVGWGGRTAPPGPPAAPEPAVPAPITEPAPPAEVDTAPAPPAENPPPPAEKE